MVAVMNDESGVGNIENENGDDGREATERDEERRRSLDELIAEVKRNGMCGKITLHTRKVGSGEVKEMSPRDLKDMGEVTDVEVFNEDK